jgi:hypothetical protein
MQSYGKTVHNQPVVQRTPPETSARAEERSESTKKQRREVRSGAEKRESVHVTNAHPLKRK